MDLSYISYTNAIHTVIAIFVIADPFGNTPIFMTLTMDLDSKERKKVITKAVLVATLILLVFTIIGPSILDYLNVTMNSFTIAGGILLIAIAFNILIGKDIVSVQEKESIAITPFATPLLAGPGAMTTALIFFNRSIGLEKVLILLAIIIAMSLTWIILINSDKIFQLIKKDGANVITKIMGIVLASIGIEMMSNGLKSMFPILASI
ncbi:MAG: MarC family protein [Methanosarcinales archaeon]